MRSGSYGEYCQDAFIIKLNVPIDFNNIANSDDADHLGTFFHEYFHFLQNMSTTFGNLSMANFYAKVMNILNVLSKTEDQCVKKGILPNEGIENIVSEQDIALGDMEGWTYERYDFLKIKEVKMIRDELLGEYADYAVPQVELILTSNGGKKDGTLNFGAMCIMESMADMLERKLYGQSKDGEYVQYDICELLWSFILEVEVDSGLVFRCCEYSLMYDNPGQVFYGGLRLIKHYIDRDKSELSENLIDQVFKEGFKPNYNKSYCEWYAEMISKFRDLLPEENRFCDELFKYINGFCEVFHSLRKYKPLIFTDLYHNEGNLAKIIFMIFMHVGSPLIINSNNEVYVGINPKEGKLGMEEYAAFYALYKLMGFSGGKECPLKPICKSYKVDLMDQLCDSDPLMSVGRDKLCILGQLLYMWQVKPKKIC